MSVKTKCILFATWSWIISVTVASTAEERESERAIAAFEARQHAAEVRSASARRFFESGLAGSEAPTLEASFPDLYGAPLGDPTFLEGFRFRLADRSETRARERVAELPEGIDAAQSAAWRRTLSMACNAEDIADGLTARLIAALDAGLDRAPGFREDALAGIRSEWRHVRQRAESVAQEDPAWRDAAERSVKAGKAEAQLSRYVDAAQRAMAVPGARSLEELVVADLATLSALSKDAMSSDLEAKGIVDRLERSRPLVRVTLSDRILSASGERLGPSESMPPASRVDVLAEDADRAARLAREASDAIARHAGGAAEHQRQIFDLRSSISDMLKAEAHRHESVASNLEDLRQELMSIRQAAAGAIGLSILDSTRGAKIDSSYSDAKKLVATIRSALNDAHQADIGFRKTESEERKRLGELRIPTTTGAEMAGDWSAAIGDLESAMKSRRSDLDSEQDALVELLVVAKAERRTLRTVASHRARAGESRLFFSELIQEIREATPLVVADARLTVTLIGEFPSTLTDPAELEALFWSSLDLVLIVLVWLYARSRSEAWLLSMMETLSRRRLRSYERYGDGSDRAASRIRLQPLAKRFRALGHTLVDVVGALLLFVLLFPHDRVLAFAALVWSAASIYRGSLKLTKTAISDDVRRVLSLDHPLKSEVKKLTLTTVRSLLFVSLSLHMFRYISLELFGADRLHTLVTWLGGLVLWAFLAILLLRWQPWIREYVDEHVERTRLTAWLAQQARPWPVKFLQATVGAAFLVARAAVLFLIERGWLSGVGKALARIELADGGPRTALPVELRRSVLATPSVLTRRAEEARRLEAAFDAWQTKHRRGLVAVIGERGMGKSAFLKDAVEVLKIPAEFRVVQLAVPHRPVSAFQALALVAEPLQIELSSDGDVVAAAERVREELESASPRIFLVDNLHHLLLRRVGGFDALATMLQIMMATSERHFWVVSIHLPAWMYVTGVTESANLAFRDRIRLRPLTPSAMRGALEKRIRLAGFEPRFESLVNGTYDRTRSKRDVERATTAYWKLLTEASRGNPAVGMSFWLDSLRPPDGKSASGAREVPVGLFEEPPSRTLRELSDRDLFLLAALVVHDGLSPHVLADVLDLPVEQVRARCRHLQGLGVLEGADRAKARDYAVAACWQPAVLKYLDQRSFVRLSHV